MPSTIVKSASECFRHTRAFNRKAKILGLISFSANYDFKLISNHVDNVYFVIVLAMLSYSYVSSPYYSLRFYSNLC